ncbi:hypothetical protein [Paenibacillus cremeus]|uniref:DUF559 domain-containing protein n=1 Tax=Paenibacillus cremeus TaxID=2163881 RepID=A0A559K443_9BACL|nr:hypothetical protein [Paenibacillus cremeus]TVY06909.1 hypothetical protein FPZ49_26705 [Paenibacillus cremeus]
MTVKHSDPENNDNQNNNQNEKKNWDQVGKTEPTIHPDYHNTRGEEWLLPPRPTSLEMDLGRELKPRLRAVGIKESGHQLSIDRCWVDYAILFKKYKIAVEVHSDNKVIDLSRQSYIRHQGWIIIDVYNSEIKADVIATAARVVDKVLRIVNMTKAN